MSLHYRAFVETLDTSGFMEAWSFDRLHLLDNIMWYARVTEDIASRVIYMMLLVHRRIDDLDQVSHDNLQGLDHCRRIPIPNNYCLHEDAHANKDMPLSHMVHYQDTLC